MESGKQKNDIHLLSTRPLEKALLQEAAAKGILIDEISFIKTEVMIPPRSATGIKALAEQSASVIFTSMNAVNAIGKYVTKKTGWNIYCIGNTTKKTAAKFFGISRVAGTAANASLLAQKIIENPEIKSVTFFCGDQRREELPRILREKGITVNEIIVYQTLETPETIRKFYDGILFYSPSAVKSFLRKNKISAKTRLFAIGSTTAAALQPFAKQPVIIAETPGKQNLVKLAISYFSKSKTS